MSLLGAACSWTCWKPPWVHASKWCVAHGPGNQLLGPLTVIIDSSSPCSCRLTRYSDVCNRPPSSIDRNATYPRRGTARLTGFPQPDSIPLRWLPKGLLGLGLLGIWRPRFSEVMQKWGKALAKCESDGRGHGSQARATPLDNRYRNASREGPTMCVPAQPGCRKT